MNLALKRVRALTSYTPPLAGRSKFDGLLLDFNERSQDPVASVRSSALSVSLNRYPEYEQLTRKLARYCSVDSDQIVLTAGSDQAIDAVFRTFVDQNDSVIIPSPGFAMTRQAAKLAAARLLEPSYTGPDLAFPLSHVIESIDPKVRLIVVCNPNSPTGTLISAETIRTIADAAPRSVVMVDEAYYEFSGVTAAGLIATCPNVVITRTFSKAFGLAGLRIGYIIASQDHANELRKVVGPYAVSSTAHAVACAALDDLADMEAYVNEVTKRAKPLVEEFLTTKGIRHFPSAANFILFEPGDSDDVAALFHDRGILVRRVPHAVNQEALRVTITTTQEAFAFVNAYDDILAAGRA